MSDERTFPHAVESVGRARHYALEALGEAPPDVIDSVAVMVSELATNSVRHAASAFTLSIERDHRQVRVAVTDDGDRLPSLRVPDPRDHSGRGLQIVRALADEWGVTESVGRPGKTVWFVLALRAASTSAARASRGARSTHAEASDPAAGEATRPRSEPRSRDDDRGPRCSVRPGCRGCATRRPHAEPAPLKARRTG
jgi:anti-sigma regulatory factor (Ser/Thr protein kinase)